MHDDWWYMTVDRLSNFMVLSMNVLDLSVSLLPAYSRSLFWVRLSNFFKKK